MLQPTVPPTGGATGSAENALSQATSSELGKDDFLKLLTTQLQNQTPSDPMKGREFAAQLAQFTSVEQLTSINSQLEGQKSGNGALAQSINDSMATNLIGRTVEATGKSINWTGDGKATVGFDVERPASEVTLTIRDAAGNAVRSKTVEDVSGSAEITWDGTTDGGSKVPEGAYSFDVSAADSDGEAIGISSHLEGTVDRITLKDGGTQLWLGGAKISMGRVQSVAATN